MHRLLPLLVVAQAAGILAIDRSCLELRALLAGVAALLAVCSLPCVRQGRALAAVGLAFAGGACGLGLLLERAAETLPEPVVEATVDAVVAGRETGRFGARVELRDAVRRDAGAPIPSRIELRLTPHELDSAAGRVRAGDRMRARLRLRALRALANPGAGDRERSAARRGIAARASLVHPALALRTRARSRPLEALREGAIERLLEAGRGGALLAALALGERRGLPEADTAALSRLGVMHLLAVSGLHLALVAGLVHAVVSLALRATPGGGDRDRRPVALACALIAGAVYAMATALRPPVLRAAIVIACLAAGHLLGRPRTTRRALWLAAGIVLTHDPAALFSAGAQLSFAATAALVNARAASPAYESWIRAALRRSLDTSATAIAATAAILAAHGLPATPVGLAANVIAVPWCAIVLLPAAGLAAAAAGLGGDAAWARLVVEPMASLGALALDAAASTASGLERVPLPIDAAGGPPWGLALGASAVCALLAIRATTTARRIAAALAATQVLALQPGDRTSPRFVALDVGAGDALLVQGRSGTLLVDGGFAQAEGIDLGRSAVVPALRALGVARLDAVAATHADADHAGGLAAVLERVRVEQLWLPGATAGDPGFAALRAAAARAGVRTRLLSAAVDARRGRQTELRIGDLRVEVLWPPRSLPATGRNASSLVLRIELEATRLLLTGDLDAASERELLADRPAALEAEILKVAHHGSASSTSAAFLSAVGPEIAVVSAPCDRRGLPARPVLERIRASGATLAWTGRDGAVHVGLDPPLRLHGQRSRAACARPPRAP